MSNPFAPRRVCVTVKVPESKRYAGDNPWLVFEGDVEGVKEMIAETFGISVEGLSLADAVINAQHFASGLGAVSQGLGGTVLGAKASEGSSDVWAQAAAARGGTTPATEEKPAVDPILEQIENANNVADLQQIWAENQAAFNSNATYMDAYKAKGKSFTAA